MKKKPQAKVLAVLRTSDTRHHLKDARLALGLTGLGNFLPISSFGFISYFFFLFSSSLFAPAGFLCPYSRGTGAVPAPLLAGCRCSEHLSPQQGLVQGPVETEEQPGLQSHTTANIHQAKLSSGSEGFLLLITAHPPWNIPSL